MFSIVVVVNNLKRLRTLPDVFWRDLLRPVCQSSPFGRGTRGRRKRKIRLFLPFCFLQFSKLQLHKFCQRVPKQYSEPVARLPLDVCRSVLVSHSSARKEIGDIFQKMYKRDKVECRGPLRASCLSPHRHQEARHLPPPHPKK